MGYGGFRNNGSWAQVSYRRRGKGAGAYYGAGRGNAQEKKWDSRPYVVCTTCGRWAHVHIGHTECKCGASWPGQSPSAMHAKAGEKVEDEASGEDADGRARAAAAMDQFTKLLGSSGDYKFDEEFKGALAAALEVARQKQAAAPPANPDYKVRFNASREAMQKADAAFNKKERIKEDRKAAFQNLQKKLEKAKLDMEEAEEEREKALKEKEERFQQHVQLCDEKDKYEANAAAAAKSAKDKADDQDEAMPEQGGATAHAPKRGCSLEEQLAGLEAEIANKQELEQMAEQIRRTMREEQNAAGSARSVSSTSRRSRSRSSNRGTSPKPAFLTQAMVGARTAAESSAEAVAAGRGRAA